MSFQVLYSAAWQVPHFSEPTNSFSLNAVFLAVGAPEGVSLGEVRVMAPGQFGNRSHARLYSIMDLERRKDGTEFAICVRRCSYIDDFNGEEYKGVASNYLCDLRPDEGIDFACPVGYPFVFNFLPDLGEG